MPWKECHVVDERLRFVARLLDGEKMAALCAEFGISRKTGYKIFDRYKDCGLEGLTDRSRRPYRHANQLPMPVEKRDRAAEAGVPELGRARRSASGCAGAIAGVRCPAISTVHAVLDRHGLVTRRRRRRYRAEGHGRCRGRPQPNDLWCADYKGEFMLADRRYCYPLTITDFASRYLLACEALSTTQEIYAFTVFERAFQEFGLPQAHPHRQRRAVRLAQRALRPEQAVGVVAAPRHRARAHQARPSRAERPPRAHAPDAEEGSHQARRGQRAAAAGPLRCLPSTATTTSGRTRRSA